MLEAMTMTATRPTIQQVPAGKRGPRKRTDLGPKLGKVEMIIHKQHVAAQESAARAADAQELAARAKAAGMKRVQVRAEDGKVKEVWSFASSYRAMGFQDHQIHAAERFGRDWEAAYRTLKGQGYEASVDGARGVHRAHFSQVDAQSRLQACEAYLGKRSFDIVRAVVVHGATAREIHAMGGKEHRTVKSDMDVAFNDLDAFYTGTRRKDRTWDAIERFNAERAAMIEMAEREVG